MSPTVIHSALHDRYLIQNDGSTRTWLTVPKGTPTQVVMTERSERPKRG